MHQNSKKRHLQNKYNQRGQGMVEYAMLLLLIAAAAALSLTSLGEEIVNALRKLNWGSDETTSEVVTVSVLDAAQNGVGGVRVFAYNEQGDYLETYQDTDAEGNVTFDLENGRFQFMANHQLQYYWSETVRRPGQNHTNILTGQAPFTVTVLDPSGNVVPEIPVYVYTEDEEYTGITGETSEDGTLKLDLVDSTVKFQVEADGNTQWSDAVPTSDQAITITLNPCGTNQFFAEYFNNQTLSDAPLFTRCEPTINNSWKGGGPGEGIGNNNYSVRWTGQFQFEEGTYGFSTTADDGVRVWLDGKTLTDAWKYQSATTYTSRQKLSSGLHELKMEYFEAYGDATAKLRWDSDGQ